ncbi:cytochrome c biogenesis protein ResB [Nocardioides humi]|jgi:cytochrome c biogenesis protein|nr:cytochrome c biogenesis protein ResB [Nocardioides humi]
MRTAVILLALLALAAVPGSVLPQRNVASDPAAVLRYEAEHPRLAPWLDRLGLFEVYSSPWFAATYMLLLLSMTGCVLPRCARLWREMRATPSPGPRRLDRMDSYHRVTSDAPRGVILARTAAVLRGEGYRIAASDNEIAAEKGYSRELGNLAFHLSLLVLLFGMAGSKLLGYEGRVALVEGETFTNVSSSYDALTPAALMDVEDLTPFSVTLRSLETAFAPTGPKVGEPRKFDAAVSYSVAGEEATANIRPNEPLDVDGTKLFLSGHGYAPKVTVRDGRGEVVFSDAVIFLPSDAALTSDGVIKVPSATPGQLGFEGVLLPTAPPAGGSRSQFPALWSPRLDLTAYAGNLGMDDGTPQSVFTLDKSGLRPIDRKSLRVGETMRLPDGAGSITFDGVARFANFQVARDPGKEVALVAGVLLLVGLTMSLVIRRRRQWIRVTDTPDGGVAIELAGRSLTRRTLPEGEAEELLALVTALSPERSNRSRSHT